MLSAQTTENPTVLDDLYARFGADAFVAQPTADHIPTLWVAAGQCWRYSLT